MNVLILSTWEQLGSLDGWSELATGCNASPFAWPTICVPWWYEVGWGSLLSVAVEEAGLLVGLALVHDRAVRFGRHEIRFLGDQQGCYFQLLIADDRPDITVLLWEQLLSRGWGVDLRSVPTKLAEGYAAAVPGELGVTDNSTSGFVDIALASVASAPRSGRGPVRTVTDPDECLGILTGPADADRWRSGAPGSRAAAYFASAVDASVRSGRAVLHLEKQPDGLSAGVLVLHGSRTSVVWRHVGLVASGADGALVEAAVAEAAGRGSERLVWPDSAGVPGRRFPISNLSRSGMSGSYLQKVPGFASRVARSYRSP